MRGAFIQKLFILGLWLFVADGRAQHPMSSSQNQCLDHSPRLRICGSEPHHFRILAWMDKIRQTSIGQETLLALENSPHQLMIVHNPYSWVSAGKTLAPLTSSLTNGRGASTVIYMNFDIPEQGSHRVSGVRKHLIPFTALQNFFHELAHARHKMNGTWHHHRSEPQAIDAENTFRRQWSALTQEPLHLRSYDHAAGEKIWQPLALPR